MNDGKTQNSGVATDSALTSCSDIYFRNSHGVNYRIHRKRDGVWWAQKKFLFWWTDYMTENFEFRKWEDREDALFDVEITDGLTISDPNDRRDLRGTET